MRYLKKQVINRRAPYDQRLQIDANNTILMSSPSAVQVPAGGTANRPITGNRYGTNVTTNLSGMIRYNTDTDQLEGYQHGAWRPFRFKEASLITQQNLGAGDGSTIYFGPLTTYTPTVISSEVQTATSPAGYGGQNLLVIVENVIQIFNTNYTIAQNPTIAGEVYTGKLSIAGTTGNTILYFNSNVFSTGASCVGTTATVNFSSTFNNGVSRTFTSFASGSTVTVTGFTPSGYNGTFVLTSVTNTSVSYTVASTLATATAYGEVISADTIYPAVNLTGAIVTGNGSIQASTAIQSYVVDQATGGLLSVTLNKSLTGAVATSQAITLTVTVTTQPTDYYLKFVSPVPFGKSVTVLGGFDS